MEDWLSYRLSDLLLFSPRTYYRMFELYHQELWPAQLLVLALVVAIIVVLRRTDAWVDPAIAAFLAACWLWVGIAFHLQRYATINWAARYFAAGFVLQAALLVWSGVVRRRVRFGTRRHTASASAAVVFAAAVAISPLAGRATERTWSQVELLGLTPDATALATLALLVTASRASRWLVIVPLAWCLVGGATLWALESPEAWVSIVAGVGGLVAMFKRTRRAQLDHVRPSVSS
jgi:hypothetical protein